MEILTYLTPGNLTISGATQSASRMLEAAETPVEKGPWLTKSWKVDSVIKSEKWSVEKCGTSINFLLVSARFSRNDRKNPFCFAIALETLWMTVHAHAANTDTPNKSPVTLLHSFFDDLDPKFFWGHLPSPSSGENGIESPRRCIALMD